MVRYQDVLLWNSPGGVTHHAGWVPMLVTRVSKVPLNWEISMKNIPFFREIWEKITVKNTPLFQKSRRSFVLYIVRKLIWRTCISGLYDVWPNINMAKVQTASTH